MKLVLNHGKIFSAIQSWKKINAKRKLEQKQS